jgi:VanZ family protein
MKYELIFLITLILYTTVISFIGDVKIFIILLLTGFLVLYELFRYYFKKRIQGNMDIIVNIGAILFAIIVFQKIIEIINV